MESKVETTTEDQKSTDLELSKDIETAVTTKKRSFSMPNGMSSIPMDKILYYADHPELEPPVTIKNMVNLQRIMAEDAKNILEDTDSDSSSDIFYSSSEEEEEKEQLIKCEDADVSISSRGIRLPGSYISNRILEDIDYAYVEDGRLNLLSSDGQHVSITLSNGFDGNLALSALEEWVANYR